MMRKTHRAFAGVFWFGSTLAVNAVSLQLSGSWAVHPAVVLGGFFIAPWFSAGRFFSPDIDHRWAPGPPRNRYNWRYHRGFTHRVWFAALLSAVFGVFPFALLLVIGAPGAVAGIALAPVNGWWSHLAGDMIYGRILIGNLTCDRVRVRGRIVSSRWHWNHRAVGLGWTTGGLSETGRPSSGGSALIVDPAAKVCAGLAVALAGLHFYLLVVS